MHGASATPAGRPSTWSVRLTRQGFQSILYVGDARGTQRCQQAHRRGDAKNPVFRASWTKHRSRFDGRYSVHLTHQWFQQLLRIVHDAAFHDPMDAADVADVIQRVCIQDDEIGQPSPRRAKPSSPYKPTGASIPSPRKPRRFGCRPPSRRRTMRPSPPSTRNSATSR